MAVWKPWVEKVTILVLGWGCPPPVRTWMSFRSASTAYRAWDNCSQNESLCRFLLYAGCPLDSQSHWLSELPACHELKGEGGGREGKAKLMELVGRIMPLRVFKFAARPLQVSLDSKEPREERNWMGKVNREMLARTSILALLYCNSLDLQ